MTSHIQLHCIIVIVILFAVPKCWDISNICTNVSCLNVVTVQLKSTRLITLKLQNLYTEILTKITGFLVFIRLLRIAVTTSTCLSTLRLGTTLTSKTHRKPSILIFPSGKTFCSYSFSIPRKNIFLSHFLERWKLINILDPNQQNLHMLFQTNDLPKIPILYCGFWSTTYLLLTLPILMV